MRRHGPRLEVLGMQPNDHIGWVYTGRDQFAALARRFLGDGVARGEKLMYVAEDPEPGGPQGLGDLLDAESLQVTSIAEVYGPTGIVDARAQRAVFSQALAQAREEGFTGIRVAADNTPLVTDDRRFTAWLGWEMVADRFMADNPVTGLCAFDAGRTDVDRLRHLTTLHPLCSAHNPRPQYQIFADEDGVLHVQGLVDTSAVAKIRKTLRAAVGYKQIRIDLRSGAVTSSAALKQLESLAQRGFEVTLVGDSTAIAPLARTVPPSSRLVLSTAA